MTQQGDQGRYQIQCLKKLSTTETRNERQKIIHRGGEEILVLNFQVYKSKRGGSPFRLSLSATCLLRHSVAYFNISAQHAKTRKNLPYLPFPMVPDSIKRSNMTNKHQDNKTVNRCCISYIMLSPMRATVKGCSPTLYNISLSSDQNFPVQTST